LPLQWQETGDIDFQHPGSQINGVLKFSGIAALPDIFRSEQLDHHPAAVLWVDFLRFKPVDQGGNGVVNLLLGHHRMAVHDHLRLYAVRFEGASVASGRAQK
jgi:hypothetical protein